MNDNETQAPYDVGPAASIVVDLEADLLSALEAFIAREPDPKPTRPEAIRYLLRDSLIGLGFIRHREDPEGAN